eukprot:8597008-Pyramimonas_sp.AAC.1
MAWGGMITPQFVAQHPGIAADIRAAARSAHSKWKLLNSEREFVWKTVTLTHQPEEQRRPMEALALCRSTEKTQVLSAGKCPPPSRPFPPLGGHE